MTRVCVLLAALMVALFSSGCATYLPPSGRADLSNISSLPMQESFAAQPATGIPASIAAVRVQAPQYRNYHTQREGGVYGGGRYSVVTVKEVEDDTDLQRLTKLPDVAERAAFKSLVGEFERN